MRAFVAAIGLGWCWVAGPMGVRAGSDCGWCVSISAFDCHVIRVPREMSIELAELQ